MNAVLKVAPPEPLWFIDTVARIHVDGAETDGRLSVVESLARVGNMPPLHVHHREDEVFHVLEGHITLHLPGEQIELEAGSTAARAQGHPAHVPRRVGDRPLARRVPAGRFRELRAHS